MSDYIERYLAEVTLIARAIDRDALCRALEILVKLREEKGRLFILGVGGSAANASHAVNDFRKIAGIEAYTPSDNVSELTARVNDDGWESVFAEWLRGSRLTSRDCVMIFSVGGGNEEKKVSVNLVRALRYAKEAGASVIGLVGRDGGYTARCADAVLLVPVASADTVTPHTESFQAVLWHLLVSHPVLKSQEMKWESIR